MKGRFQCHSLPPDARIIVPGKASTSLGGKGLIIIAREAAYQGRSRSAATAKDRGTPAPAEGNREPAVRALWPTSGHHAAAPNVSQLQAFNPRVLFITASDSPQCVTELVRLNQPEGDFERMRARGWKIGAGDDNHLQLVDQAEVADVVQQFELREFPIVVCISGQEIVRSFRAGCTTPLDAWTFGWLARGINERPHAEVPEAARVESTGNYPLRGNHWSIDGDVSPAREKLLTHLRGPVHGSQLKPTQQIEQWSYEELRSLHDYLHEQEMGGVYHSPYASRQKPHTSHINSASSKVLGR